MNSKKRISFLLGIVFAIFLGLTINHSANAVDEPPSIIGPKCFHSTDKKDGSNANFCDGDDCDGRTDSTGTGEIQRCG